MTVLVLLRHGESAWNAANVFTGWIDVGLSEHGENQAQQAGALLAGSGYFPEAVHTSVQRRAIRSADLALAACGRAWVPVRRTWRLNSNHYGALQGRSKAEVRAEAGEEQFMSLPGLLQAGQDRGVPLKARDLLLGFCPTVTRWNLSQRGGRKGA
jgi:2,3-bisphosphoglycerate-dependent phosphoglycerate mutase